MKGGIDLSYYKKREGHKYYIDMGKVKFDETFNHASACSRKKQRELKRLDPFAKVIGCKPKYQTPAELKKRCDEYFESLMKPVFYKGAILRDENGETVKRQEVPATLSGLASYLGIQTDTLRRYQMKSVAGLIPPEFAEIVLEARQKIEVFCEEQLYTRDGSRGAQFVLQAGFSWQTKHERSEDKLSNKKLKMAQQELELKRKMVQEAQQETDKEIKIAIVRAVNKDNSNNKE